MKQNINLISWWKERKEEYSFHLKLSGLCCVTCSLQMLFQKMLKTFFHDHLILELYKNNKNMLHFYAFFQPNFPNEKKLKLLSEIALV